MSKDKANILDTPLDSIETLATQPIDGAEKAFAHTLKNAEEAGGVRIGAVLLLTPRGVATTFFPANVTIRQIAAFLISTALAMLGRQVSGSEPNWQK